MNIVIETADNGYIILSKEYPAKRMVATDKESLITIVTDLIKNEQK